MSGGGGARTSFPMRHALWGLVLGGLAFAIVTVLVKEPAPGISTHEAPEYRETGAKIGNEPSVNALEPLEDLEFAIGGVVRHEPRSVEFCDAANWSGISDSIRARDGSRVYVDDTTWAASPVQTRLGLARWAARCLIDEGTGTVEIRGIESEILLATYGSETGLRLAD